MRAGRLLLRDSRLHLALLCAALLTATGSLAAAPLRVNGSTTVNPIVDHAARVLRDQRGLEIQVDTLGGSAGGIAALADGRVDLAMAQAERLADRVGCLCVHNGAGELVESARAGDFFADPRCGRPAALLEREDSA